MMKKQLQYAECQRSVAELLVTTFSCDELNPLTFTQTADKGFFIHNIGHIIRIWLWFNGSGYFTDHAPSAVVSVPDRVRVWYQDYGCG